jgi:sterol desaturase/sphingolipid hydroxylase (fatty acid hydroxylase superfamily)
MSDRLLLEADAQFPDPLHLASAWFDFFRFSLGRVTLIITAVWFLLWIALAGVMRYRKIREDRPPNAQVWMEIGSCLRTVIIWNTITIPSLVASEMGLIHGAQIAKSWGPLWFWVSLLLITFGHDTYFYWTHRMMHSKKFFRIFHRHHHRSRNPSRFTAFSFSVAEAVLNGLFVPIWILIVPTSALVVFIFTTYSIVLNAVGHCGYEVFPARKDGRPLLSWLISVTHHDLHHRGGPWNFAFYFSFWDRWMGTEHPEYLESFKAAVTRREAPGGVALPRSG